MKLTKREVIMFIALAVIVLLVIVYTFMLKPQLTKITQLEEKETVLRDQFNKIKKEISEDNSIHFNYKVINTTTATLTEPFFPQLNQEKFILLLEGMFDTSGLDSYSIAFSEPVIDTIEEVETEATQGSYPLLQLSEQFFGLENEEDNTASIQREDSRLNKMVTTIYFNGNYSNVTRFIKSIEDFEKMIIIKNLNMVKEEDGKLKGSAILEFYALPKLHEQDEDFLKWDIDNDYGKDNPFSSSSGQSHGKRTEIPEDYDFAMTVKPISSDLPTIVLGRTNDSNRSTYVYGDSNSVEDIEIYFTQNKGNYYYKYKTKRDAFPQDFSNGVEFNPEGETINFQVFSHERNGSSDLSGVKLMIDNKTDKKVFVTIIDDDLEQPRVNIAGQDDRIVINRE